MYCTVCSAVHAQSTRCVTFELLGVAMSPSSRGRGERPKKKESSRPWPVRGKLAAMVPWLIGQRASQLWSELEVKNARTWWTRSNFLPPFGGKEATIFLPSAGWPCRRKTCNQGDDFIKETRPSHFQFLLKSRLRERKPRCEGAWQHVLQRICRGARWHDAFIFPLPAASTVPSKKSGQAHTKLTKRYGKNRGRLAEDLLATTTEMYNDALSPACANRAEKTPSDFEEGELCSWVPPGSYPFTPGKAAMFSSLNTISHDQGVDAPCDVSPSAGGSLQLRSVTQRRLPTGVVAQRSRSAEIVVGPFPASHGSSPIKVTLHEYPSWETFCALTTEMIITKAGRWVLVKT